MQLGLVGITNMTYLLVINIFIFISIFLIYDFFYSLKYKLIKQAHLNYTILYLAILTVLPIFINNTLLIIISITIILSTMAKLIFLYIFLNSKVIAKYKKSVFLLMLFFFFSIGFSIYYINNINRYFVNISNQEIEYIIYQDKYNIIYVGRPSCPQCAIVEPLFRNIARNNSVTVYYYNTHIAREENSDKMIEVITRHNINTIPTVLYTRNGEILYLFDMSNSEDIVERFELLVEKYLLKTN